MRLSADSGSPWPLRAAAVLVWVLAMASLGFAVLEAASTVGTRPIVGLGTAAFMSLYAIGLGVVGWGLWRAKRWSRGPAVATQLMHLPLAWSFFSNPTKPVAVVLAVIAVAIIACVFSPPSMRSYLGSQEGPGDQG